MKNKTREEILEEYRTKFLTIRLYPLDILDLMEDYGITSQDVSKVVQHNKIWYRRKINTSIAYKSLDVPTKLRIPFLMAVEIKYHHNIISIFASIFKDLEQYNNAVHYEKYNKKK
jgi:hypothetical protein